MLKIKVLGGGCTNCVVTYKLIKEIALEEGREITLEKVEEMQDIMAYDILATPAVVIDEVVVHRGSVPLPDQVKKWFTE